MIFVSSLELDHSLNSSFDFNEESMRQLAKVNSYALKEGVKRIFILGVGRKAQLSYNAHLLLNNTLSPKLKYHFILGKQDLGKDHVSTDLIQNLTKHKVIVYPSATKISKSITYDGKQLLYRNKPVKVPPLVATQFDSKDRLGFIDATGRPKVVPLKSDISLVTIRTSQLRKPKKNERVHLIVDTKDDFSKFNTRSNIVRVTREVTEVEAREDGLEIDYDIEAFIQAWLENNNLPVNLLKLRQELIA